MVGIPRASTLFVLLIIFATACQATGTGRILSTVDPEIHASFGFVYDGTTQTFSGSYHDHTNGVRFKGTGVMKAGPPPAGTKIKGGCLMGEPTYESQDPSNPGVGMLTLLVCDADGDAAVTADDYIGVLVVTGPYVGYFNEGSPSGNVTVTSP